MHVVLVGDPDVEEVRDDEIADPECGPRRILGHALDELLELVAARDRLPPPERDARGLPAALPPVSLVLVLADGHAPALDPHLPTVPQEDECRTRILRELPALRALAAR